MILKAHSQYGRLLLLKPSLVIPCQVNVCLVKSSINIEADPFPSAPMFAQYLPSSTYTLPNKFIWLLTKLHTTDNPSWSYGEIALPDYEVHWPLTLTFHPPALQKYSSLRHWGGGHNAPPPPLRHFARLLSNAQSSRLDNLWQFSCEFVYGSKVT